MKPFNRFLLSGIAVAAIGMTATVTEAANPYAKPDEAYISLTGKVLSKTDDEFKLDYGNGVITIETDEDWGFDDNAEWVKPGMEVTVHGEIDDDFYEGKTIEAESVYVPAQATYYYMDDDYERDSSYWAYSTYTLEEAEDGTRFGLSGIVSEISGSELILDTGLKMVTVETATLDDNPLDNEGYQRIDVGDRIYVSGVLDRGFFVEDEIEASNIITLRDNVQG